MTLLAESYLGILCAAMILLPSGLIVFMRREFGKLPAADLSEAKLRRQREAIRWSFATASMGVFALLVLLLSHPVPHR